MDCSAEVVVFTAGLEDYAAPICNALESRYGRFAAKLFRPATVASDAYPCVKVCTQAADIKPQPAQNPGGLEHCFVQSVLFDL